MKIGIVGKSGSGKSTLTQYFVKKGFHLIDMDQIGKDIAKSAEVLTKIKKTFGEEVFDNGVLNRKKLGDIVFSDQNKLDSLNKIFSKPMKCYVQKQLKQFKNCVLDGYKLSGFENKCDIIIGIDIDDKTALERLIKREPNTEKTTLENRLEKQTLDKQICNFVFDGRGTSQELIFKLEKELIWI